MSVVAVVPAREEAARIAATVTALRSFCDDVIVVDDGSGDETSGRAAGAGARVLRSPRSRGKGAALARGLREASGEDGVVLLCDGDLGESAASLKILVDAVVAGDAELAIGAPPRSGPSGFGMVESLARDGIRILTGRTFARPLSGQRALTAQAAHALRIAPRFAVETAMTIDALRLGFRVAEIPCEFTHAATGRDAAGFAHRARQGADILAALARRSLQRPLRRGIVRS